MRVRNGAEQLDPVGHAFLRYARPERFGDVKPEELRRYGQVYDRYADYLSVLGSSAPEYEGYLEAFKHGMRDLHRLSP